jgi:hypothetical protein
MKTLMILATVALLTACGIVKDDRQWVQERSGPYYEQRGFKVLGYQGFNMWTIGRCYWYTLEKNGTTYQSCLLKWGDEVQEYSLQAVDAIKGTSK